MIFHRCLKLPELFTLSSIGYSTLTRGYLGLFQILHVVLLLLLLLFLLLLLLLLNPYTYIYIYIYIYVYVCICVYVYAMYICICICVCIYIYRLGYIYRGYLQWLFTPNDPVSTRRRILSIVFNPNGTRCVTTDNNGVVGVWKTDQRGLCNQIFGSETFKWISSLYLQGIHIYIYINMLLVAHPTARKWIITPIISVD